MFIKNNKLNFIKRKLFYKLEIKKLLLNYLLRKFGIIFKFKIIKLDKLFFLQSLLNFELKNFYFIISHVSIKNSCILSGYNKNIFRYFKLSRIHLRYVFSLGFLTGLKKR